MEKLFSRSRLILHRMDYLGCFTGMQCGPFINLFLMGWRGRLRHARVSWLSSPLSSFLERGKKKDERILIESTSYPRYRCYGIHRQPADPSIIECRLPRALPRPRSASTEEAQLVPFGGSDTGRCDSSFHASCRIARRPYSLLSHSQYDSWSRIHFA